MSPNKESDNPAKVSVVSRADQIIFTILMVFSLVGVALTSIAPVDVHNYWIGMIFVFACAAIYCGRRQAREKEEKLDGIFLKHVIHWFGALMAILCVYTLLYTGNLDREVAGLIMLLVLALSTFLAGVHIGWRFYILGAILALTTVTAAYIEEFMWMIMLLAVIIVGITFYWGKRKSNND